VAEPTPAVPAGLTGDEARRRLAELGPNAMPDMAVHPLRSALAKLWAPVPWMLEAAILLQIFLGEYVEAAIVGVLLVLNAALGFFQESRAQATLAALKARLALTASVRRDGLWQTVAAVTVVPGDLLKLSLGSVVAADARLIDGAILLDQSMLTGESLPIEAGPGLQTYAGALVRRGEAVAEVTATGTRTKFGRTAELVRTAHVVSSQQKAVLRVVRNLALFNGALIVLMVIYARAHAMPVKETVLLGLTAVLASIPVALPATFTLAAALGARALARQDVLPTRLSAVDEAATMDVLCADKTGTLTRNALEVTAVRPLAGFDESHLLALAALASTDGGEDPVDGAIRAAAARHPYAMAPKLLKFVPFDPAAKMAAATVEDPGGGTVRIVKGAFSVVAGLVRPPPGMTAAAASTTIATPASATTAASEGALTAAVAAAADLEAQGLRVLAVAAGPPAAMRLAGMIALSDPPRPDSAALVAELRDLGVRTIMVSGDAPATAAVVARAVGLTGAVCPAGSDLGKARAEDFAVFAGVLPEAKYQLVKVFQQAGHIVGMCGDGANDAPALRQAQIGIAVSTATDVAKSAAGVVLTQPGLGGIVAAVKEGRRTFQRILTYTLSSVTKKVVQVLFLVAGLLVTGHAILTPMLMVIVMITGDFLGMALTADHVAPSPLPNAWRIGSLTLAGIAMGVAELIFCVVILGVGEFHARLGGAALQTLGFLTIVFGNQASIYAIRSRRRLWSAPRPSRWLLISSAADLLVASALAGSGVLMARLPLAAVAGTLGAAAVFAFAVDVMKVPLFRRLRMA
jgi:H+-transporting ATPase